MSSVVNDDGAATAADDDGGFARARELAPPILAFLGGLATGASIGLLLSWPKGESATNTHPPHGRGP